MNHAAIDALGQKAAEVMMRGAADYLAAQHLKPSSEQVEKITEEMRARSRAALAEALKHARQALKVPSMEQVAEATFLLTMKQAGIDAVKAVLS